MSGLIYGNGPVTIDPAFWGGRAYDPTAPQDVGAIQAALAGQLQAFFASANLAIPVYVFPDFDLDTWWASSAIAFVLISYEGTRFGRPMTTDTMVQERTLSFAVHVEARQVSWALTGPGSVYALIDAVEAALTGFRAPSCRNAYFSDERFAEQDPEGRVWLYDMRLEVPTLKLKTEPQYALANLAKAIAYAGAVATNPVGVPDLAQATYILSGGTTTLPGPYPVVVAAVTDVSTGAVCREILDYTFDGTTGVFTAVPNGQIGESDTLSIAWAHADTVTAP